MILIAVFAAVTVLMRSAGLLSWWSVAAAVIVTAVYYRRDVRRRPRVPCRFCAGSGERVSHLGGGKYFRRPFGNCWCCGGTKAHARMALRVIDPARYRAIRDEIRSERTMI